MNMRGELCKLVPAHDWGQSSIVVLLVNYISAN